MSTQTSPKPPWLKVRAPGGDNYARLKQTFRSLDLHTVCEEASCPNVGECWGGGTATIMLLGDTCTRGCRFCHVKTGKPNGVVDALEPVKVGSALGAMDLTYVVLTSVDRDDLADGGADHFGRTVEEIKKRNPLILVEVLVSDFRGDKASMERIVSSGADVIAHNLETVERLTKRVRDPRCGYRQSLEVLAHAKRLRPTLFTKSSIMVGLGETREEMGQAMDDLREVGVDILTIGQYLRPSDKHLAVEEFIHPTVFKAYEEMGLAKGFKFVPSGPLVRSSYKAGEKFIESQLRSEAGKA